MQNGKSRIYLSPQQAEQIVRALDEARLQAMANPDQSALLLVCSAAQWVVHQPPFLEIHQALWKEREQ